MSEPAYSQKNRELFRGIRELPMRYQGDPDSPSALQTFGMSALEHKADMHNQAADVP